MSVAKRSNASRRASRAMRTYVGVGPIEVCLMHSAVRGDVLTPSNHEERPAFTRGSPRENIRSMPTHRHQARETASASRLLCVCVIIVLGLLGCDEAAPAQPRPAEPEAPIDVHPVVGDRAYPVSSVSSRWDAYLEIQDDRETLVLSRDGAPIRTIPGALPMAFSPDERWFVYAAYVSGANLDALFAIDLLRPADDLRITNIGMSRRPGDSLPPGYLPIPLAPADITWLADDRFTYHHPDVGIVSPPLPEGADGP